MGSTFSQFFPPSPSLTEANISSQKGKVFIVTGGATGVGYEICSILYAAGARVYLAGRNEAKAQSSISNIKSASLTNEGTLTFLSLILDDLTTIEQTVREFDTLETRLDGLFNNAGVSNPPRRSVSVQGHELQMATNCLGPYLLTQLLLPTMIRTAKKTPSASTRVIWTSSIVTDVASPKGGIPIDHLVKSPEDPQLNYTLSKTGNWFLADALAKQAGPEGILSVTINPGNLRTELTRHMPSWVPILVAPLLYEAKYGAYTNLWAALSQELTIRDGGKYIVPWGRVHSSPRKDLVAAMKTKAEGGTGEAALFVDYCEKLTDEFRPEPEPEPASAAETFSRPSGLWYGGERS